MYPKIFCFLLFIGSISFAQSNKKIEISLSTDFLNGKSWGGNISFSGELNYLISKDFSVSGLYRHGSGFGWYGASEHRPEMDNDVSIYNEISTYFNYNFDDTALGLYVASGFGIIWGNISNGKNYLEPHLPIMLGSKIHITSDFKIGLRFMANINSKITFTGLGLNLIWAI